MSDSFRYAWKEIKRRKRRSIGAILSYLLIGAHVVVVSSLAGITRDSAQTVLWDIGAHSVAYIPRLTLQGCCIQTYATDLYDPDREGFVVNPLTIPASLALSMDSISAPSAKIFIFKSLIFITFPPL